MNPVIFEIGPFSLHWYGVFIVGGAVLAAWVSSLYAAKAGENPDHVWNILAWALVGGIIGARLYHVFSTPADGLGWAYYREHPLDIINFWNGGFRGLGIYGGLLGGTIAIAIYCWYNKLDFIRYLDFVAPNVLLAQAVGRLGNFVNQELYGPPTKAFWAFHINPSYPCQVPDGLPANIQVCGVGAHTAETLAWYAANGFHPTFFYEALWSLSMWGILSLLIWQFGQRLRKGDAILLYLITYPLGRFWVELFRPDAWVIGQLATAQWIALISIAACLVALILRHYRWSWRDHPQDSLIGMSKLAPKPPQPANAG